MNNFYKECLNLKAKNNLSFQILQLFIKKNFDFYNQN